MRRPRLLAVFPDALWPPTAGIRVRNHSVLEALSADFDTTVVYLAHDQRDTRVPDPVARLGRVIPVLAPHRRSRVDWVRHHLQARLTRFDGLSRTAYFQSPVALARAVRSLLREESFDVVHVAYWYTLRHLAPFTRPPVWILDTHDVFFQRETLLYASPPPRGRVEEERLVSAYDAVIAMTEADAAVFRPWLRARARLHEVGMGVEIGRWARAEPDPSLSGDRQWIVFYGALATEPNLTAVRELWERVFPRVAARRPGAALLLLGSSPAPEVTALGREEGVLVPGTVPEPARYLRGAAVMALPLRVCSGFRTRAVEAMASARAIVAYPEAMAGLRAEPGRDWVCAGGPEEMADAIIDLLEHPERARGIGANAQRAVLDHYTWEATYGRLPGLYRELMEATA